MSDVQEGAGGGETVLSDQVEEVQTNDAGDNSAVETEAREMGWRPKEEFKGDPEKWRPADEFVQRGKEILPIVRSQLEKERKERADDRKAFDKRVARLEKTHATSLTRQRDQIVAEFEGKKREAVKLGDEDSYDAAEKGKEKALKALDEQVEAKEEPVENFKLNAVEQATFEIWHADNDWFQSDKDMTEFADAEFNRITKDKPGASMAKRLSELRKSVAEKFPAKFDDGDEKPSRRGSAVEGGARIPGGGQAGKLSAKLPAEARTAGLKYVEQKLYANLEDYAKVYFEDGASA